MILYIKLISGEDIVCKYDDDVVPDSELEKIQIHDPYTIKLYFDPNGGSQISSHRWGFFLNEKYKDVFWLPQKLVVICGLADEEISAEYTKWLNSNEEHQEAETSIVPQEELRKLH